MDIDVEALKMKVVDYLAEDKYWQAIQHIRNYVGGLVKARAFVDKVKRELDI